MSTLLTLLYRNLCMTLLFTKVFYVINLKISFILICLFCYFPPCCFQFFLASFSKWIFTMCQYYATDLEEVKNGEDIDLAWKFSSPRLRIICKTIVCITHRMENSKMPLMVPKRNRSLQRHGNVRRTGLIRAWWCISHKNKINKTG